MNNNDRKMLTAVKFIKQQCDKNHNCESCPCGIKDSNDDSYNCALATGNFPFSWEIFKTEE